MHSTRFGVWCVAFGVRSSIQVPHPPRSLLSIDHDSLDPTPFPDTLPDSPRDGPRPSRGSFFDAGNERNESRRNAPMSTYLPKPGEISQAWHVVDATDQVLGRLAA